MKIEVWQGKESITVVVEDDVNKSLIINDDY